MLWLQSREGEVGCQSIMASQLCLFHLCSYCCFYSYSFISLQHCFASTGVLQAKPAWQSCVCFCSVKRNSCDFLCNTSFWSKQAADPDVPVFVSLFTQGASRFPFRETLSTQLTLLLILGN